MTDDNPDPVQFGFDLDASASPDGLIVTATLTASLTVSLLGMTIAVDDIAQGIGFQLNPGADKAFSPTAPFTPPTGASATVNLPAVSGQGALVHNVQDDSWSGALLLQLSTLSVDAFAVISAGPSFVVLLCARFPPPGIQVGFGFAVSGVGGVFGLNRRSDRDALTAAILDGSLSDLLFPRNAQDDATRIAANLPTLFPDSPGQLIVGPMLEITWAGGLLAAEIMLLVELPNPLQVSVLGQLTVDLPVDDAAIVHLEARVGAIVTPSVPEFRMVASLTGSTIAGFPLTGDVFLLIRGGPEATFVFSAGGFHPAAKPPPNVPPMKRLGMVMSLSFIELRCENYLAVTTSSVQLGSLVELSATIGDNCGIRSNFQFDALIEWKPQFHMRVDLHIGLSVEVFGEHLMGVSFDGYLAGPGPWELHGRGEVEVLLVSVAIPIDATFGARPQPLTTIPDVGKLLAQELAKPSAWIAHPPAAVGSAVTLSATALGDLAAGIALHPGGSLHVVQRLVPLEMTIDRFGGYGVPAQCWTITGVGVGADGTPIQGATVTDTFADGTFTTLTADQQLSINGFTEHPAGMEIFAAGFNAGALSPPVTIDVLDIPVDIPAPSSPPPNWVLQNPAAFVPLTVPAVTVSVPGNPVTVSAQPPLADPANAALVSVIGHQVLELWETQ
jgi:hypothetical protein